MSDQMILDLKTEGKSLREIASILGVSHVAVRKRLKKFLHHSKDEVLTSKGPSHTLNRTVNPSQKPICKAHRGKKAVFQAVSSEVDDLFEAVKEFLKEKGIEVYRMNVESEAYQVSDGKQIIRFYVFPK